MSAVYTMYAFNINAAADVLIDGCSSQGYTQGAVIAKRGGDGGCDPRHISVDVQNCGLRFSTMDLPTCLALNTSAFCRAGFKLDESNIGEAFYQKTVLGGERESGSNHIKKAVNLGMLVPRTLTATRGGGPAELAVDVIPIYDGTNDPITFADSQALAGTPTVSTVHYIGPIDINGTDYEDEVVSVTVDFGIQLGFEAGVHPWPTSVYVAYREPRIVVGFSDAAIVSTFGLAGTALSSGIIYFRKGAKGSDRVLDATAEHVKLTIYEGWVSATDAAATHPGPVNATVAIELDKAAANDIMTYALAAIT